MENIIKKLDEIDNPIAEAQEIISSMRYNEEEPDYSTEGMYKVTFQQTNSEPTLSIKKTVFAESICDAIAKASITEDAPFPSRLSDREYTVTNVRYLGKRKFIRVGDELKTIGDNTTTDEE